MEPVPRHGPSAFRCGCGAFVKVEAEAQTPRDARIRRCAAEMRTGPCSNPVSLLRGIDWLCKQHYELMLDHALAVFDAEDAQVEHHRNRQYAHLFALTEPDWDLSTSETERILDARDAVRGSTTLDAVRWLRRRGIVNPVVYFLGFGGLIKIGTTVNVQQRIQSLSLPQESLMATEPGGRDRESALHDQFAGLREYGEWFRPAPELLAYIDGLPSRVGPSKLEGNAAPGDPV